MTEDPSSQDVDNGPAKGLTFSVAAPALGVALFLAILGTSTCDAPAPIDNAFPQKELSGAAPQTQP